MHVKTSKYALSGWSDFAGFVTPLDGVQSARRSVWGVGEYLLSEVRRVVFAAETQKSLRPACKVCSLQWVRR
jgi:hypothetical protein